MRTLFVRSLGVVLCAVLGASCLGDRRCDPGMVLENQACTYPAADAAPVVTTPVSSTASNTADGGMCSAGEGFGAKCKVASDCPCGLDYCNTWMNANECTRTGCKDNPSICPKGWMCLVLGFPGTPPSVCSKI